MKAIARTSFCTVTVALFILLCVALGTGHVSGAPNADGDLDPTFGIGGKVTTSFPGGQDSANAVTIQSDGKIISAGAAGIHTGLARYMPDGTPDPGFGASGKVVAGFTWLGDSANAVALQLDGKIITAGQVYTETNTPHFALMRFNTDGSPDTTFGTGGQVATLVDPFGDRVEALAIQPDGKIIAVGSTTTSLKFAIVRYDITGALDASFGSGGIVTTQIEAESRAFAARLQPDGKIVAAGYSAAALYTDTLHNFTLVRYLPDGTPDPTFGTGGIATTDFDQGDEAHALVLQTDGKILAAGFAHATDYTFGKAFALARYTTDGMLDSGFGTGGMVTTDFEQGPSQNDRIEELVLRPDGKIVAAGGSLDVNNLYRYRFALARYDDTGTLDPTFDADGKVLTVTSKGTGEAKSLALQPDGKVVAVGFDSNPNYSINSLADALIIRYTEDGTPDAAFGTNGLVTTDFVAGNDSVRGIAIQDDGKIVAVGSTDTNGGDFGVARYMPDGTLDPLFGTGGKVTTDILTGYDQASAVAIQPDGKIVVVGTARELPCNMYYAFCTGSFAVVRYNSDGSLDSAFGTDGKVTTDAGYGYANGIALQPDGKLVVIGARVIGNCTHYCTSTLTLIRYNSDGDIDAGFGNNGEIDTRFKVGDETDSGRTVAIQPDGKIVAVGYADYLASSGIGGDFGVARYMSDGSPDQSFGTGGIITTDFYTDQDTANALVLRPDGRIVVGGSISHAICEPDCIQRNFFGLVSFNADGTLDATFGDGGKVVTDFPGYSSINALGLQIDGKIIAAGEFGGFSPPSGFAIARYLENGTLDPNFGVGGKDITTFGGIGGAYTIAIQPDSKIVVGGQGDTIISGIDFALVRYTSVVPPPPTPTTHPGHFQDVPPEQPFYTFIECISAQGVIGGYPCGGEGEPCGEGDKPYFRPANSVTRGQVAKMISIASGNNDPISDSQQTFTDVPVSSPFWLWIERLSARNIIGGYECGSPDEPCDSQNRPYFRPGYNLTRGQLAKISSIAAGYTGQPSTQTFTDVPPADSFYPYIERLVEHDIISGYICGGPGEPCDSQNRPYFRPATNITRGPTAKIVTNTFFPDCQGGRD